MTRSGIITGTPIYKRIILKITGEAFSGTDVILGMHAAEKIADEIEVAQKLGVQMGIVVGGGNIVRGRDFKNIKRITADRMGMLGTVINSLFLQDILEKRGIAAKTQTAIEMDQIAESFLAREAILHMEQMGVVIFACGTGNPYFSTDSAAILRAYELDADAVLKGTKVDGLYDRDPAKQKKSAKLIPEISYADAQKMELENIIDNAALGLVRDNARKIPLHIFNILKKGNLKKLLLGEKIGSKIF